MNNNQIMLDYPDGGGEIRTLQVKEDILFCLYDVVRVLSNQNINLASNKNPDGVGGLVLAQLEVLDDDEVEKYNGEEFVTQSGLFRIILRDSSDACKKFQRWVLHDVLPSIQKYGIYPPPLASQDSSVKKAVMLLLSEIEEREALEKKTKEQFLIHEKKLKSLEARLNSFDHLNENVNYFSISDFCLSHDIDAAYQQILLGWCIKIVAEDSEPSRKMVKEGEEITCFPDYVLVKAANKIFPDKVSSFF